MRFMRCALAAMIPFLLFGAARADHLDQSFVAPTTSSYGVASDQTLAQTFTVGLTGTLDRIGVQVYGGSVADLTIDIIGTIGGTPDPTNILASLTAPPSDFPTTIGGAASPIPLDLGSQSFAVTAGEVLAIELSTSGGIYGWVNGGTGGSYSGGDLYYQIPSPPTNPFVDANTDAGFQTFVQTSAVPEPSGLVMLGSGIAGVLAYAVRRRVGAQWTR